MSAKTPLNWEGTGSYSSVAANLATVRTASQWLSCWSQPTTIAKGDDVFVFEVQVSRSTAAFFGFAPSGLVPQIQANPNAVHVGSSSSSQTPGFGVDGKAYFGTSVVAQPLESGSITVSQPYTVTLTVDLDSETIGCTITQPATSVRGQMTFAQCGCTKGNAKELRMLASWVSDVAGTTLTLYQRTEKSAAAKRQASRPLLEPCTCARMRAHMATNARFAYLTCRSI